MIKSVLKKWWFWLIAVILVSAVFLITEIKKNSNKQLITSGPSNEKIYAALNPDESISLTENETEQTNSIQATQQPTASTSETNAT